MIKVCQRRTELALSPGKRKGLQAVSNPRGVIAAMAIDQRDALRGLFAAELKVAKDSIPREQLEAFKSIVVRALSPYASAVLLEPEYGLQAASERHPSSGLLMAYEESGYDRGDARLPEPFRQTRHVVERRHEIGDIRGLTTVRGHDRLDERRVVGGRLC